MVSPDGLDYWDGTAWTRLPGDNCQWDGYEWQPKPPGGEVRWNGQQWCVKPVGVASEWDGHGWVRCPSGRAYWDGQRWVPGLRPWVKSGLVALVVTAVTALGFATVSLMSAKNQEIVDTRASAAAQAREDLREQQRASVRAMMLKREAVLPGLIEGLNGSYVIRSNDAVPSVVGATLHLASNPGGSFPTVRGVLTNPANPAEVWGCFNASISGPSFGDISDSNYDDLQISDAYATFPTLGDLGTFEWRTDIVNSEGISGSGDLVGNAERLSSDPSQALALWPSCPYPRSGG